MASDDRRSSAGTWPGLLLIVATLVVYARVAGHEFVALDDPIYVATNADLHRGLTWDAVHWAFTTTQFGNWHPLTWLSYLLDFELWGLWPGGYHLTNLVLHLVTTALLLATLQRWTGNRWCSFAVAALFALHPLRVESVAWVSERKDVLSGLCFVLALAAHGRYANEPSAARLALVSLWAALGLMAKPMLVTLPFVLLLLDYWPLRRFCTERVDRRRALGLVLEKLPLFALSAASSMVTLYAQRPAEVVLAHVTLSARVANALLSYVTYLRLSMWPRGLMPFYPHPGEDVSLWLAAAAAIGLVTLSALALQQARRRPYLGVGWLWFAGMLVPVIGLVQVGGQSSADRYVYLPLIGLSIAAAWLLFDLRERATQLRRVVDVTAACALAALAACTWAQVGHWRSSEALFEHALAVSDSNYLAHVNLGGTRLEAGRHDDALAHYERALQLRPELGDVRRVVEELREAARDAEQLSRELEHAPASADLHFRLGVALQRRGRTERAVEQHAHAIRLRPDFADAYVHRGMALEQLGQLDAAIESYTAALRVEPRSAAAHYQLGLFSLRQGELARAIVHFEKVVELAPDHTEAHSQLERARSLRR